MPKVRLIAATLLWSVVPIGLATLALVEGVQGKPDRSAEAVLEIRGQPHDGGSGWKDDTGVSCRRQTEAFDSPNTRQPVSTIPTVWQDPPRR